MTRKEVIEKIGLISLQHCEGCGIYKQFNQNRVRAHRYCLEQCEIGLKIRELGKILEKVSKREKGKLAYVSGGKGKHGCGKSPKSLHTGRY